MCEECAQVDMSVCEDASLPSHLTQTTSWTHPLTIGKTTAEAHSHGTPLSLET